MLERQGGADPGRQLAVSARPGGRSTEVEFATVLAGEVRIDAAEGRTSGPFRGRACDVPRGRRPVAGSGQVAVLWQSARGVLALCRGAALSRTEMHPMRGGGGLAEWSSLDDLVETAWRSFERAAALRSRVSPAIPILFFGDLDAYRGSPLRVLTVGLNPSLEEFPAGEPFLRFPLASDVVAQDRGRYLKTLAAYFRTNPYRNWFRHFEPLLNGMRASYYPGETSTTLHTDICSPIATNPTWSRLGEGDRAILEADGGPLWHVLLEALEPHLVVLSVARRHLDRIRFNAPGGWRVIHAFERTSGGAPRSRPYEVSARWHRVGGGRSLFVFCPAGRTPLTISNEQKRALGAQVVEVWRRER